jgi:bifunctional non-homologous end joining protein LigD
MLATTGPLPLGPEWAYEVKWDGVRALVAVEGGRARATSRNGNDITGGYPELALLDCPDALVDGELVALVDGVPDFGALQSRMHVRSPGPALLAATPVTFLPFDVLHVRDSSVLGASYDERRSLLAELLPAAPELFLGDGEVLLETTRQQGLEGLVAKRRSSAYLPGRRSDDWVKVKHISRASVVVCGWKEGEGGRSGRLGSLLLGVQTADGLVYAGHVGTGFSAASLTQVGALLTPLARSSSPYSGVVPREHARAAHWVEPVLVAEVDFTAWTRDGRLRHPSFKGLRNDIDPAEVVRE